MQAVLEVKPSFALIAGGRPQQASHLEAHGIPTYIHVPVPSLLKAFLKQGARRFVFEGRECGGHIGPLASFVLWENMIETLLEEASSFIGEVSVLFAGGIHDAISGAMISGMSAQLVEKGCRVGVLMGTAYLFTEEVISCGAIVETFQQKALTCDHTANVEVSPGHAIRCIDTFFVDEFYKTRRNVIEAGASAAEVKQTLESLTVGRLRIASKGLTRNKDGSLIEIDKKDQLESGMYMIGQVATLQNSIQSIADLHKNVSEKSVELLLKSSDTIDTISGSEKARPSDVAIIGISTFLPGASEPATFWNNILRQVNAIKEIPGEYWDWKLYFDANPKTRDKMYSKWGGFIDDIPFDPLKFGIPPNSLEFISCSQILSLEAVRLALIDAGYDSDNFLREKTSVILGSDGGSSLNNQYIIRTLLPLLFDNLQNEVWERLPEWTEESFPGNLTNIISGRISNRFDFGGSNYTVDAACASALTAVSLAVQELESGQSDMVITGGIDTGQTPHSYIAFSKTQALSPKGKAQVFDQSADGIVISEGITILVLKRVKDAQRDGDKIYAVIKGIACSSDGKALGLTAPRSHGQKRTFERAYQKAGFNPNTLGLYEAHGTGTAVGDRVESETMISLLKENEAASKSCAIGSIKSLIGHTKTAAGAVGLAKAALALYHKTLPPHFGVEKPLDALDKPDSPVYLLKEARPWLSQASHPRRASVSAFGFGGTNAHAVLEEYRENFGEQAVGSNNWSFELFTIGAIDKDSLIVEINCLLKALEDGAEPVLKDLCYSYAVKFSKNRNHFKICFTDITDNLENLKKSLTLALAVLENKTSEPLPRHLSLNENFTPNTGKIAFIFPGQGSQYPNMARESALYINELRDALEFADEHFESHFPKLLSQYIYPPGSFSEIEKKSHDEALRATQIAQPAIGVISIGYLQFARRLGLKPDMVCGHSYGEFTALYAAGVLSKEDFLSISEIRGRAMAEACRENGSMKIVQAAREIVVEHLENNENVFIANCNAPQQTVISGNADALQSFSAQLKAVGILSFDLPVAGAFHSPLMAAAQAPILEAIKDIRWQNPKTPVYSNVTSQPYPPVEGEIQKQVGQHLLSSVEFMSQIEQMYSDGARIFIELGAKSVLTDLIKQILKPQQFVAVSLDGKDGNLRALLSALSELLSQGVDIDLPSLFAGRKVRLLDLQELAETTAKPTLSPTSWLVNGMCSRPINNKMEHIGNLPPIKIQTDNQGARQMENIDLNGYGQDLNQPIENSDAALRAFQSYQETMSKFLTLQEEALKVFLNNPSSSTENLSNPEEIKQSLPTAFLEQPQGNSEFQSKKISDGPVPNNREQAESGIPSNSTNKPSKIDEVSLTETLIRFVSVRTGYPPEMLDPEMDLEAELGVDSIKRMEILNSLQESLPPQMSAKMAERMDIFTGVKSLKDLVKAVLQETVPSESEELSDIPKLSLSEPLNIAVKQDTDDFVKSVEEKNSDAEAPCPRYIIEAQQEELFVIGTIKPDGFFLITEDALGIAAYVAAKLEGFGADPVTINQELLSEPLALREKIADLIAKHGNLNGIIHLAAMDPRKMPEDIIEWKKCTQIHSKSLFQILSASAESLQSPDPAQKKLILSASLLGGFFGRNDLPAAGLPTGGSSLGLLKTMENECDQC